MIQSHQKCEKYDFEFPNFSFLTKCAFILTFYQVSKESTAWFLRNPIKGLATFQYHVKTSSSVA